MSHRAGGPAAAQQCRIGHQDERMERLIVELHSVRCPEKQADKMPGRLHGNDGASLVMAEQQRGMFDFMGMHVGNCTTVTKGVATKKAQLKWLRL